MEWYYAKNGSQFGPVDDEELHRLAREGGILPEDLVWNASMGNQWITASSIETLFPRPATPPPIPNEGVVIPVPETSPYVSPPTSVFRQKIQRFFAPVAAACMIGFKYLAGLKFLLPVKSNRTFCLKNLSWKKICESRSGRF